MRTAAAISIILSFAARGFAAPDDPPTPHGNIPNITVDLRSSVPSDIFPFDQRFNIHGLVEDDVRSGKGFYKERSGQCGAQSPADATPLGESRASVVAGKREVAFTVVDPLLAHSKDYCFWFQLTRELTPEQLKKFQTRATEELDHFFRTVEVEQLPEEDLKKLRLSLIAAVKDAAPSDSEPAPEEGSIFHENSLDVLRARFTDPIGRIVEAQNNRKEDVEQYCEERPAELKKIADATAIIRPVLNAIDANRNKDALKKLLADFPEASDALTALRSGKLAQATDLFCNGGAASPRLRETWHAASLDAQIAIWKKHLASLEALRKVAEAIAGSNDLLMLLGIDEPTATQAAQRIGDMRRIVAQFDEGLDIVHSGLAVREATIKDLVDEAGRNARSTVPLLTTTMGDFQTQHNFYVSADVGLAFAPELDATFTYAGMNIYLRPVNKQAGLSGFRGTFTKRFSFIVGLTLQDVKRDGAFKGVINDRCVVAGAGFRLLNSVRIAGGAIAVREFDPNPNVTQTETRISPFISISLDWDVRKTLAGLGSALNIPN